MDYSTDLRMECSDVSEGFKGSFFVNDKQAGDSVIINDEVFKFYLTAAPGGRLEENLVKMLQTEVIAALMKQFEPISLEWHFLLAELQKLDFCHDQDYMNCVGSYSEFQRKVYGTAETQIKG